MTALPAAPRSRATDVDAGIGLQLRRLRIERGLSQQEMGDLLGVTYQQLHKYERGINRLSAGKLLQVLAAFGVDLAEFAAAIAVPDVPKVPVRRIAELDLRMHRRLSRLTAAQRSGLMALLGGEDSANG